MNNNLLQHQMNKFGVVTVMDAILYSIGDKPEPLLFLDTLKVTSISQEGETKDIRGGIGAPELLSYDFARTVSLEIQDALASMSSLQVLWGGKKLTGDTEYTAMFKAKVETEGSITPPKDITLKTGSEGEKLDPVIILDKDNNQTYEGTVAAEDKINVPGIAVGTTVSVFVPATLTLDKGDDDDKGAIAIAINSVDMPPTVRFVGQTFFIDQNTGKKIPVQIEIPRLKINLGADLTMEAEGDAAVFDFNGKALADANGDFFILKQLGAAGTDIDY